MTLVLVSLFTYLGAVIYFCRKLSKVRRGQNDNDEQLQNNFARHGREPKTSTQGNKN